MTEAEIREIFSKNKNKSTIPQNMWNLWKGYLFDYTPIDLLWAKHKMQNGKMVAVKLPKYTPDDIRRGCFQTLFKDDVHQILSFLGIENRLDIKNKDKAAIQEVRQILEICRTIYRPPENRKAPDYTKVLKQIENDYKTRNPQIMAGCALYIILSCFDSMYDFNFRKKEIQISHTVFNAREIYNMLYIFQREFLPAYNKQKSRFDKVREKIQQKELKFAQDVSDGAFIQNGKYWQIIGDIQSNYDVGKQTAQAFYTKYLKK